MSSQTNQRQLTNWIADYTAMIDKISESPIDYHLWTAISVIGAVLKDHVWIDMGAYKIYPNQFIILVGGPGVGKGTSIHYANDFVRNPPNKVPLAHYIMDAITTAKLIEVLSKGFPRVSFPNGHMVSTTEASCILQVAEFPVLFDTNNSSMTNFLCEAWSRNEYYYSTKNGGVQVINNLCLSLIAACVPEFIKDINKTRGTVISNGLTSRMIFVHGSEKSKKIAFAQNTNNAGTIASLSTDLEAISRLNGEFTFNDSAKQMYIDKYDQIKPEDHDSEVVTHFKARQPAHILKTAMAMSAAARDDLVIDDCSMAAAILAIDHVLKTLDIVFRGVGDSTLAAAQARILYYLERKQVAARNEILRDNYRHVTGEDLDRILAQFASCGFVNEFSQGNRRLFRYTANGAKP